jgi:hypothetical protein
MMAARSVRADVGEVALGVGRQLSKLEDVTGGASTVNVNGLAVHRASAWTTQSQSEVLDRFAAYCRQHPTAVRRALGNLEDALKNQAPEELAKVESAFVIRAERDESSVLVCFADRPAASSVALADWITAMNSPDGLDMLGRFFFVTTTPSQSPDQKTHVVTLWSEQGLRFSSVFPAEGDAPGSDSQIWPRPKNSRRLLAATAEGSVASVRVYETSLDKKETVVEFEKSLIERGLKKVEVSGEGESLLYEDGKGTFLVVAIVPRENGSSVSVVESPSSGVRGLSAEWREGT